jgi:hypothetical protein
MMRYLGYALAIVIGVAALISGITGGAGVLAGAAVGWLIASVVNIITSQSARVEGQDDAIFSIFEVPWWMFLIDVALIVGGGLIGFLIKH